jgi:hypothetical protein
MTMTTDERTVSLRVADGLTIELTFQIKASGVIVPKKPPKQRRVAEFRIDIGDPVLGESPSLELFLTADLKNTVTG